MVTSQWRGHHRVNFTTRLCILLGPTCLQGPEICPGTTFSDWSKLRAAFHGGVHADWSRAAGRPRSAGRHGRRGACLGGAPTQLGLRSFPRNAFG